MRSSASLKSLHVMICWLERAAISAAIAAAVPGDVVIVAGKGHENTQTIGTTVVPFDDVEVSRELLSAGA